MRVQRISRKQKVGLLALALITGSISSAAAATDYGYDTTVGRANGSGYTDYVSKVGSGNGSLSSYSVGGGYEVDARMQSSSNSGSWTRDVRSGTQAILDRGTNNAGSKVRVQFSNDLSTPVRVQVSGSWRADR